MIPSYNGLTDTTSQAGISLNMSGGTFDSMLRIKYLGSGNWATVVGRPSPADDEAPVAATVVGTMTETTPVRMTLTRRAWRQCRDFVEAVAD